MLRDVKQIAWAKGLLKPSPSSRHHKKDPGKRVLLAEKRGGKRAKKPSKRRRSSNEEGNQEEEGVEEIGDDTEERTLEAEEEEWNNFDVDKEEEGVDFDDNLSFSEDSLSVIKGEITLSSGKEVPIWVTTDTGSMTRLIEAEFAAKMKLRKRMIKASQRFYINGPGGGREMISHSVTMDVRLKTKKEGLEGTSYEDVDEEEVTRVVRMSFGVCRALPVPILWGGGEMRKKGMRDYHDCQVVSLMDEDGQRFITPSRSWISTCRKMEESEDRAVKHAYKGFLPSRERLVQMVMGERLTGNTQGILYPKTQSVVRLGRKNARIDEGYNEVALVNRQEIEDLFGGKVEVVDSVCQGEAFAVVINYSNEAIKLPAGTLSIVVRPAISLPTLLNAEQVRASGQNGKGEN